ncbi:hypothetical protein MRB53_040029 [Persea americana]|nr:hypothetical protein MRB53_040029 [Persea americana]
MPYSAHVIGMTIESIVPPLVASLKRKGKQLVVGASDLLLSFVAAFEHIPNHRRVATFVQLIQTLGPEDCLFAVLAMIAEKCMPIKKKVVRSSTWFWRENLAEASTGVTSLNRGLNHLLRSQSLRKRIATQLHQDVNAPRITKLYGDLLEKLIALPDRAGNIVKFDEPALKTAHDGATDALLGVLPTQNFIASSAELMQAGTAQLRAKVFASLTLESSSSQICRHTTCRDFLRSPTRLCCLPDRRSASGYILTSCKSVETALQYTADTLEQDNIDWTIVDATITLVNSILDNQSWLLNRTVLDRTIYLSCLSEDRGKGKSWPLTQFSLLAPKKIELATLLSSMSQALPNITSLSINAMSSFNRMLDVVISTSSKSLINKNSRSLFSILLTTFEWQPNEGEYQAEDLEQLQQHLLSVSQTLLDITLKLNDLTFRPFFTRLVEWSEEKIADKSRANRKLALYTFAHRLFSQLGSIVTSYAGLLSNSAVSILAEEREPSEIIAASCFQLTLQTLAASFEHDQDDFWSSPQHFEQIATPLINLLTNDNHDHLEQAISTIVELAFTVSVSPENLKTLNTQILAILRDHSASTRLAAVKCQRAITSRLKFDWLNMLPEMLPFVSELLEDEDGKVEREVLSWVSEMEEVTGESLEGMLA